MFAGPPVGGVGRGAYADLRVSLSAARWVVTEPGEGITWLEFFAWFDACRKRVKESLSAPGSVGYAEAT
eukprot:11442169-Alexandrium_andersonii.AAC.1